MEIKKTIKKDELKQAMNNIFDDFEKEINVNIEYEEFYYEATDNGKIIGGIIGWRNFNEIYIEEMCVDKNYRNQGIGKKLLEIVEKEIGNDSCDYINLATNEFQNAVEFYKKCGFEIEYKRENKRNKILSKYGMIKIL